MNTTDTFESRIQLSALGNSIAEIRAELGKVIVGQHKLIDQLIVAILADGHVLIEGVPGVAKTLTSRLLARVISVEFSRIQFTPDLMPSDVLGTAVYNIQKSVFEFKRGPIFSNIVLIDEINRAPAKTQSALFEVMEERQVTIDGQTYPMTAPFIVLATQNPVEQEGTYRLPEAQLDRFLFKIEVGYPSLEDEIAMLAGKHNRRNDQAFEAVAPLISAEALAEYRAIVQEIHIDANLLSYIAQIVNSTRNNPALYLGASPRASIAILNSSKAYAAMQGRDFVTPEDIKEMTLPVLRHRVQLTPEKEMEGLREDEVIRQIINKIEVPR
jgi:MoxR-like ATPase